ncbi:hypothetical protein ACYU03_23130 [Pseudomonas sp. X10]
MDKQQAAVVGYSLMSFLPGLTAEQRSSVQLATLMAERVTRTSYQEGLIQDWYASYRNQLRFLGWDAVPPEEAHWPDAERPQIVDSALRRIGAVAGSQFVEGIGVALAGLKGNPGAMMQFEQHCRSYGAFQLLPCAPARGGQVDMVLYHETAERSVFSSGFLFRERRHSSVRAELVRFNTRLFDQQHRSKVMRSLEKTAQQEILGLDI